MKTSMSSLRNKDNKYITELPGTCGHVRMVEKLFEKLLKEKHRFIIQEFLPHICFLLMIILPYK